MQRMAHAHKYKAARSGMAVQISYNIVYVCIGGGNHTLSQQIVSFMKIKRKGNKRACRPGNKSSRTNSACETRIPSIRAMLRPLIFAI